jgi:hypothetical protein
LKNIRRERYVGGSGNRHRFAIVDGFELGEFIRVLRNQVADPPNHLAPL